MTEPRGITDFPRFPPLETVDPRYEAKIERRYHERALRRCDVFMREAYAAREAIDILNRRIAELETLLDVKEATTR